MIPETLVSILAALLTIVGVVLASSEFIRKMLYQILGKPEPKKSYGERLSELTRSLSSASSEVDSILAEMSSVVKEKESSVMELKEGLSNLEKRERELKDRISSLENVPIPVAEHFAKLMKYGERRSAKRDYVLFGAGVIVTTMIAIIIQLIVG